MSHATSSASWTEVALARWSEIGQKITQLAEEFPEERYDYRPTAGVRTVAQQLRHVAFWNRYVHLTLQGAAPDGSANELPREAYPSKGDIVAVLKETFAAVESDLENGAPRGSAELDSVVSFIEHNAEHYGQLVICYRLNGLVPPASR